MSRTSIDGYILTGGRSSRMGRAKATIDLGGKTLFERVSTELSPCVGKIYAVGARAAQPEIGFVEDEAALKLSAGEGRSSFAGLYSAIMHSEAERIFVVACDMPFVTTALFRRLAERSAPRKGAIAASDAGGRSQPLCAIYDVGICRPLIEQAAGEKDLSLMSFLKRADAEIIPFDQLEHLPGAERFFININTPDDLEIAEGLLRQEYLDQ